MYQSVHIIGNVEDPGELKYTPAGEPMIVFTVRTTRKYIDIDSVVKTEKTIWRVSAWRLWAEWASANLKTDTWVQVRGRLSPDERTGGPHLYKNRRTMDYFTCFDLVSREMQIMGAVLPDTEDQPIDHEEYLEPVFPVKLRTR